MTLYKAGQEVWVRGKVSHVVKDSPIIQIYDSRKKIVLSHCRYTDVLPASALASGEQLEAIDADLDEILGKRDAEDVTSVLARMHTALRKAALLAQGKESTAT